jgi:spermidine/putrescine transport system permease protein
MIVVYSFSDGAGFANFRFSTANFTELFTSDSDSVQRMKTALLNTVVIGLVSSLFATVLGTLGAVGLNGMSKKPRNVLLNLSNVPIFNADIITALALMFFFLFIKVDRSVFTVLIGHIAMTCPYVMLSVLPRLKQMNMSVYEAALDLGATPFSALIKIIVPEVFPGMVSGFALAFTLSIDDFIITQFNRSSTFETLSTYIYSQAAGKAGLSGALKPLSALIFLTVLAGLVIYNIQKNKKAKAAKR